MSAAREEVEENCDGRGNISYITRGVCDVIYIFYGLEKS